MTAATPGQAARILPAYDAVGERELSEAVHQALGFASVCWEPMNCTGVFEEARVRQVADELTGIIGQYAAAIAAQERPAPGLATVDLHRWYAVITQPDGSTKVIGHTDDGLGYYDSVDEWEAKNS